MRYLHSIAAILFILFVAWAIDYKGGYADSAELTAEQAAAFQVQVAADTSVNLKRRTADALDRCAQVIAQHFGLSDWSNVPYAENANAKMNPSTKDFYFAWPKGRIALRTGMGDVPISAACIGTLDPLELKYVTVNGKDVL